ncbi:MAG: chorismate mutase [Acidimicrobiales bacterium]
MTGRGTAEPMGHEVGTSSRSSVDELRRDLDAIDAEIVRLLAQRLSTVSEIASAKDRGALGVRDPEREREVLAQVERAAGQLGVSRELVRRVFGAILEDSVAFQKLLVAAPGDSAVSSSPTIT